MATSAAPGYFHNWRVGKVQKPFVDGALHSNLPVQYALDEKEKIWPSQTHHKLLDALVSVGTGIQEKDFHIPKWLDFASTGEIAKSYHDNIVDTNKVWKRFQQSDKYNAAQHHRLNVHLGTEKIGLDDWQHMQRLLNIADAEYNGLSSQGPYTESLAYRIEAVANRLVASLLFFEPSELRDRLPPGQWPGQTPQSIPGHILCRLEHGSKAHGLLLHRITNFFHCEADRPPTAIRLPLQWRARALDSSGRFAIPCTISSTTDQSTLQSLAVTLEPPSGSIEQKRRWFNHNMTPISGFPTTFRQLQTITSRS